MTEFPILRNGNSKVVSRFLEKKLPKSTDAKEPLTKAACKYMLKWARTHDYNTMSRRFGTADQMRIITISTNGETPFNDDIRFHK